MRKLLHLSDVHFGPPHLPVVAAAVRALVAERRPDLVVVSGDLTQRAKPEQFREARAFVDSLPVPVLAVPGNHDVPLYRVWERAFSPFGAYRRHFARDLEPTYEDDELCAVGVNTAFNWTWKEGRVRLARLRELAERLAAVPERRAKIVVAHHHFVPPPAFGTQRVLANAWEAIDLFAHAGVDLVLSGHLHHSFVANSDDFYPGRPAVVILHSGTSTSRRGRGPERERNTCNWIEIDETQLAISILRWEPDGGEFLEKSRHLFPRQERRPYALGDPRLSSGAAPALVSKARRD